MDYNERVKIVNDYIMKFNQMMMIFSIGIIAFSIQTLDVGEEYFYKIYLYLSWASLSITFFVGLFRMHHQQKVMTRNATESFNSEILKEKILINIEKMKSTNKFSAILYRIMITFFSLGIFSLAVFKVINL